MQIDLKRLVALVWAQLELDALKGEVQKLRGIDWNPFDEDGDEYDGAFAEIHHNWELVWNVVLQAVAVTERIIVDGASLSNAQKHKVVVGILDDIVRLPWYAEPFDGPVLDALVKAAVKFLKAVNWGIELPPDTPEKIEFKEVG